MGKEKGTKKKEKAKEKSGRGYFLALLKGLGLAPDSDANGSEVHDPAWCAATCVTDNLCSEWNGCTALAQTNTLDWLPYWSRTVGSIEDENTALRGRLEKTQQ